MTEKKGLTRRTTASNSKVPARRRLLTRITLMRKMYRVLLNTGRTYAAFTEKDRTLLESIKSDEIFDPMSGYGSLMKYCSEHGIRSYSLEYNLPQYLWQLLCHPSTTSEFIETCRLMLSWKKRWPRTHVRAIASDNWFPDESVRILLELSEISSEAITKSFMNPAKGLSDLNAALLLPFVGRLSCSVPADIVTHVKKGGICVYREWQDDFELFLQAVIQALERIAEMTTCREHAINWGDARTFAFPKRRFGAMLTSPPYPNHRDFVSMFAPEHAFLDILKMPGGVTSRRAAEHIIGSNFVTDRPASMPSTESAKAFLGSIARLKNRNATAIRHDRQYYIPYFENYFADLEAAYKNIAPALRQRVEGYIVVVNNTHRNLLIPVSDVIMEIWRSIGFNASLSASKEAFHVGTKNPRARGLRARHTEHVVKIWR
jgi:hypothetical protein